MVVRIALALIGLQALAPVRAGAAPPDDLFALQQVQITEGRTVAAELGDFDGDGRTDLLQIVFEGVPPAEKRLIRLWTQGEDGAPSAKPLYEIEVPEDSAAYDVGDVTELPGQELVLLRPQGLTVLSFANPGLPRRDLVVDGSTLVPGEDERGLDRLHMIYTDFGPEPRLLVPMLARTAFLSPSGETRALLDAGARANYFLPPRPGPLLVDSDIQLLLDVPRIAVGDVNGDARADVVSLGRHEVRVFLQREDGSFARPPDRTYKLALISERDHIRGSGAVRGDARDVSGDGKLDLMISHMSGGITDAKSETRIYLNRDGVWDLAKPDFVSDVGSGWGADQLVDIDRDGRPELLHVSLPFSVLELVEALITRSVDALITVYKSNAEGQYSKEPWFERKLEIAISFDTGRPKGFVPTGTFDMNGDGFDDLITPGDGEQVEVWLGGAEGIDSDLAGRQDLPANGRVRGGDWNGDGLEDLLLYDPRMPRTPVVIATNRGLLPGTLPHISSNKGEKSTP
ncbi:MAG: VCBS repeat-containing protein [Myxococcota bacterium]